MKPVCPPDWTLDALEKIARRSAGWRGLEVFVGSADDFAAVVRRELLHLGRWEAVGDGMEVAGLTRIIRGRDRVAPVVLDRGEVLRRGGVYFRGPASVLDAVRRGLAS